MTSNIKELIELEALITEREAMKVKNEERASHGLDPFYTEEDFLELRNRIRNLNKRKGDKNEQ